MIAYFATFLGGTGRPAASEADLDRLTAILRSTPALRRGLVFLPSRTRDPYHDDGPSPPLALELYFDAIGDLEAALAREGHLQALARPETLPGLAGTLVEQQAMLPRFFPVPDARFRTPPGSHPCSYLVHYPGPAADQNVWMDHYVSHHPPIMARFPGIREIEICGRIDWCGFLPWRRVEHMQRNKVVFDDAPALTAALNSPVRDDMRADLKRFPPFEGGNVHHAMTTLEVVP